MSTPARVSPTHPPDLVYRFLVFSCVSTKTPSFGVTIIVVDTDSDDLSVDKSIV